MVVTKVQRWHPDTCGCIIDQQVDYDDQGNPIGEPKFLLMNEICDKHQHLASTSFAQNHAMMSAHVISLIEDTKTRNLKQVDDQTGFVHTRMVKGKAKMLRDLARNRQAIQQHNDDLTEEWTELVSFPHAFDSHVHDTIMAENLEKNAKVAEDAGDKEGAANIRARIAALKGGSSS